jgi:nicotinamide riboside kinase
MTGHPIMPHTGAAQVKARLALVLGGECSGKTTLCEALANDLAAPLAPEYLRMWCQRMGRTPARHEQRQVIAGQLMLTRAALRQARATRAGWALSDGAPLLTAAYSIEYFNDDSLVEMGLRHARRAARIVLLDPEIEWQADGRLRDGPASRRSVHCILVDLLRRAKLAHHTLGGTPAARMRDCLALLR